MNLVIVESPSKAKTIEKYLGKDYAVDASGGHIRDLPEKTLGVDVKHNYEPKYEINPDKKEVISRLLSKSKKAENVYLATDPDREGEAISWHLAQTLNIPLGGKNRIVFNEISAKAVKKALETPREININLVNAQQARRVLDRLVGYKISPFLCKKIQNKLSAGRVQSVALRLIVEREQEITGFVPKEYWHIAAFLNIIKGDKKDTELIFKAVLYSKDGKKFKPSNEKEANEVVNSVKNSPWSVKSVKAATSFVHALPPFTTSTLQQDSSNKLGLASPVTMSIAQDLYEGISIEGEGHIALVTYIRTDSVRISADAQAEALKFIGEKFGKDYVPASPNFYKTKKSAQDAHEAIRPISLDRTPESLKNKLQKNHYRLYKLIYERFLASQMADAVYDTVNADISSGGYIFKSSGKTLKFKGYTAVYDDYREAPGEDGEENSSLPKLEEGNPLNLNDIKSEQKFTKPPLRFTDASLVKAMEDKGIGRPSTYATIIGVLLKRTYTEKEGKFIKPTELAFKVNELLVKYFDNIVDVAFTARMEENLDDIEEGGKDWKALIADFYPWFEERLKKAQVETVETSDVICDKCGANMVYKVGRYGKFLACPNYPECKNIKSLEEPEISDEKCDKCGSPMVIKSGKYGKYLACSNYPECSNIKSLKHEEASDVKCEKCGNNMVIREGKYGKYLYCGNCKIIKAINEAVGRCPKCGKDVVKRLSKSKKIFFGCTGYPDCDFASWDIPSDKKCPQCGAYMIIKSNKSGKKLACSDKNCGYEEKIEE